MNTDEKLQLLIADLNNFKKSANPMDFERSRQYFNFDIAPKGDDGQPIFINKWNDQQIEDYAKAFLNYREKDLYGNEGQMNAISESPKPKAEYTSTLASRQNPTKKEKRNTRREERQANRAARVKPTKKVVPADPMSNSTVDNDIIRMLMENSFSREQAYNAYNKALYAMKVQNPKISSDEATQAVRDNILRTINSWDGNGRLKTSVPAAKNGGILKRINNGRK